MGRRAVAMNSRYRYVSFAGEASTRSARALGTRAAGMTSVRPATSHDPFVRWVLARAGLKPDAYRPEPLARRVRACLRALRVSSTDDAEQLLASVPELLPRATSALVIGVTEFFRDAVVFQALAEEVLPALLRRAPGITVGSLACADGRELYSVAMLLAERGALGQSRLWGLDCRSDALAAARAGYFGRQDVVGLPDGYRERFFTSERGENRVHPNLRAAVEWIHGDILAAPPLAPCNLLLFRNASMYFTWESAAAAWRVAVALLRPGGFVVLGKAERPAGALPLTRCGPYIYRRQEDLHDA